MNISIYSVVTIIRFHFRWVVERPTHSVFVTNLKKYAIFRYREEQHVGSIHKNTLKCYHKSWISTYLLLYTTNFYSLGHWCYYRRDLFTSCIDVSILKLLLNKLNLCLSCASFTFFLYLLPTKERFVEALIRRLNRRKALAKGHFHKPLWLGGVIILWNRNSQTQLPYLIGGVKSVSALIPAI